MDRAPASEGLPPHHLLDAWNLLTDITRSVGDELAAERLLDRQESPVYDRLVASCNLPALRQGVVPAALTESDCAAIARALRRGLSSFDRATLDLVP